MRLASGDTLGFWVTSGYDTVEWYFGPGNSDLSQSRTVEKSEPIATADKEAASVDENRLALADIDGPAPFQAYVAESKDFVRTF